MASGFFLLLSHQGSPTVNNPHVHSGSVIYTVKEKRKLEKEIQREREGGGKKKLERKNVKGKKQKKEKVARKEGGEKSEKGRKRGRERDSKKEEGRMKEGNKKEMIESKREEKRKEKR